MKRIAIALFLLLPWGKELLAQTAFYQGKSIRVVVGFTAARN